jgi:hypothetical protein
MAIEPTYEAEFVGSSIGRELVDAFGPSWKIDAIRPGRGLTGSTDNRESFVIVVDILEGRL